MTRMIPPTIHSSVQSHAERRMYEVIRDAPNTEHLAGRRLSNDDAASAAAFLAHAGPRNSTTESRSCTRGTHSTRRDACINGVWAERRAS